MIARHVTPKALEGETHFRWRGGDVSRVEGLSDAVFGFALTLLVVSLDVPATFDELLRAFAQIPAFAACFAILVMCWYYNYKFHRRYGLEDFPTVVLNAILLFVILLYIYPLKFLATVLFDELRGVRTQATMPDGSIISAITGNQMSSLLLLYSSGVVGTFLLFTALNWYAYRKRDALQLNECEILMTKGTIRAHLISLGIGILSILIVLINAGWAPIGGLIYFLMGPAHGINGYVTAKGVERAGQS